VGVLRFNFAFLPLSSTAAFYSTGEIVRYSQYQILRRAAVTRVGYVANCTVYGRVMQFFSFPMAEDSFHVRHKGQ
jgi:hypothetical protein